MILYGILIPSGNQTWRAKSSIYFSSYSQLNLHFLGDFLLKNSTKSSCFITICHSFPVNFPSKKGEITAIWKRPRPSPGHDPGLHSQAPNGQTLPGASGIKRWSIHRKSPVDLWKMVDFYGFLWISIMFHQPNQKIGDLPKWKCKSCVPDCIIP